MTPAPPEPIDELTGFQQHLLRSVAHEGPCKGLDVKAAVEEQYGEEIRHGRLYPALDALADTGLIEKGSFDRRTNRYEVTARGAELVEWFATDWTEAHRQLAQRRMAEDAEVTA